MLIGPRGAGKSALAELLGETRVRTGRTPVMVYGERTIEAPGAYLECPWMHCHLIAAAQDALCVIMIADAAGNRRKRTYPPGFAGVFGPPVIGVVTKCDLDMTAVSECEAELLQAGVPGPFYRVGRGETDAVEALRRAVAEIEVIKPRLRQGKIV